MIEKFEEKFKIKVNGELKEILSLCVNEPIFFANEKRLLSVDEILNYEQELMIKDNIIPIIDIYDNSFIVYDILNKCFTKYDISTDTPYEKLDSIKNYVGKIKSYLNFKK